MLVVVCYDVRTDDAAGRRRLRHVARHCLDFGQRVQYSVFECLVNPAQWTKLRQKLIQAIDERCDSLRFYFLGANWKRRVEHVGAKEPYDPEGALIV